MSARAEREIPIRYLSVDEMMLKIAQMRAARVVSKIPLPPVQPEPRKSVEVLPELEFPDYISHCEAWSTAARALEADGIAATPLVKLQPQDVREFMQTRLGAGLSTKTVRHLRATLRAALNSLAVVVP